MEQFDVIVIGGGPAGLSAALWAARYRRRVLLVDAGEQRNRATLHSHGYLGADGISPGDLLTRGRADLVQYDVAVQHSRVTTVCRSEDEFHLVFEDGASVAGQRLVVATGVVDILPEIDGLHDHFGSSIFTCPNCDGYEARDKAVIVIGDNEATAGFAIGLLDWTAKVTVVTNGAPCDSLLAVSDALLQHDVDLIDERVVRLCGESGGLRSAILASGIEISCEVGFVNIGHRQRDDLLEQLGCDFLEDGCVVVDDEGMTTVEGVYAAGDITRGLHLIQVAAAEGAVAGVAAAQSLRGDVTVAGAPTPAPDPEVALQSAH